MRQKSTLGLDDWVAPRRSVLRALTALGIAALPWSLVPARGSVVIDAHSALIVVDVQNCFVTGGSLPVRHGEMVVPLINRLSVEFATVVMTQLDVG